METFRFLRTATGLLVLTLPPLRRTPGSPFQDGGQNMEAGGEEVFPRRRACPASSPASGNYVTGELAGQQKQRKQKATMKRQDSLPRESRTGQSARGACAQREGSRGLGEGGHLGMPEMRTGAPQRLSQCGSWNLTRRPLAWPGSGVHGGQGCQRNPCRPCGIAQPGNKFGIVRTGAKWKNTVVLV